MVAIGFGLALLALAGCGDSSSGSTPPKSTSTTRPATAAAITTFDVPASVPCTDVTKTTVTVGYATTNARKVQLYVDGLAQPNVPMSGSLTVPVHCDALPHDVVVRALDRNGHPTVSKKVFTIQAAG
jgi:hypothetical protein